MKLRTDYLTEFPKCQYTQAIGGWTSFPYSHVKDLCIEHIWNRKGYSDHWSNYATTCDAAHKWKHAHSVEARIGITAFKFNLMRSTGDERHFDVDELWKIAGFNVPGWIENKIELPAVPEWARQVGKRFLEEFYG